MGARHRTTYEILNYIFTMDAICPSEVSCNNHRTRQPHLLELRARAEPPQHARNPRFPTAQHADQATPKPMGLKYNALVDTPKGEGHRI